MKLIVGLGNPGKEYEKTRHNLGFLALDIFFKEKKGKKKFNGYMIEDIINGEKVIFFKPQSFMNLSGDPIAKIVSFYNISYEDILIIHDDLDLPLGKMKLKQNGSSGGHNGIKSIEIALKSNDFKRLKIGINRPIDNKIKDYVLGKLQPSDLKQINFEIIENIIKDYVILDFANLMNKYNGLIN